MAGSLQQYILTFSRLLNQLNLHKLVMESYAADYLKHLIQHHQYYLQIYAHVLQQVLDHSAKNKSSIVLVDYGAGNGLLGMFARHCGFGGVYLVDNNASFSHSAQQVAKAMGIAIHEFIIGDYTLVQQTFQHRSPPDAIVGTDVIEHIYNLDDFFSSIAANNSSMVTVFTTASVTANPFKSKQLQRLQYRDEHLHSNPLHAQDGDPYAGLPFKTIRKQLLINGYPSLAVEQVERLAINTRGLNKTDLLAAAEAFVQNGVLPHPLQHKTNTCDPVTGSWTERLLTVEEYRQLYQKAGFTLQVCNGFYNEWQQGPKGTVMQLLNTVISIAGRKNSFFSPFITLVGTPFPKKISLP